MSGSDDKNRLVLSYLLLRKSLGVLGVLLPVILVVGDLIVGSGQLQDSISHYYGTVMRSVFVGVLFAIGVFLFSYIGYKRQEHERRQLSDNAAGNLACLFALGVALFPTTSDVAAVRMVHFVSAVGFFLTLAYFSLVLFVKTKLGSKPSPQKVKRNQIYRICGWTMIGCLALIGVYIWFLDDTVLADLRPVLWLETAALWAFGISWFTKGETWLADSDQEKGGTPSLSPI